MASSLIVSISHPLLIPNKHTVLKVRCTLGQCGIRTRALPLASDPMLREPLPHSTQAQQIPVKILVGERQNEKLERM